MRLGDVADVRIVPARPSSSARPVALHRCRRQRERPRSRCGHGRRRRSASRHPVPARVPRRGARRSPSGRRPRARAGFADRGRDRDLPAPAGGLRSWRLAAVVPSLTLPLAPGGRRAGGLPRRRHVLARVAGRLLRGAGLIAARNGIMLISHYQRLEQRRGRSLWSRAGPARDPRTLCADPDDRVGDRPGLAAVRRHAAAIAGLRDRAPDGGGDPGGWSRRRCSRLFDRARALLPAVRSGAGRRARLQR